MPVEHEHAADQLLVDDVVLGNLSGSEDKAET